VLGALRIAATAVLVVAVGGSATAATSHAPGPALATAATGLPGAVFAAPAPSGRPGRLYVVQRAGLVRIVDRGRVLDPPFVDLRSRVASGGLRGLFSLAFDPHYDRTDWFYVGRDGDVYVSRLKAVHGVAARSSEHMLLRVPTPQKDPNSHYGGQVAFGPDGRLYASFGDGGLRATAQDRSTLLGKLVRLDVRSPQPQPETVAVGLRNPWRFSFDAASGDLYIGDVGESSREEVDRIRRSDRGVANLGWPYREGSLRVRPAPGGVEGRLLGPLVEYRHARGRCNSVTGGYVYRGKTIRALSGRYVYGDLCGGVWSVPAAGGRPRAEPLAPPGLLVSFAEGAAGELYLITLEGRIYEVVGSGGAQYSQSP
jgi:glucose/arabinose dehydrogenase